MTVALAHKNIGPSKPSSSAKTPCSRIRPAGIFAILTLFTAVAFSPAPVIAQERPSSTRTEEKIPHVRVDTVIRGPAAQTFPVIGRLVAKQSGMVSSRIPGPVAEIPVEIGDRVEKGDLLAVLYGEALHWKATQKEAELGKASAAVDTAKAQLKLRELTLRRLSQLRKSSAFNPARFDDARQEVAKAKSAVAEAEAAVAVARANLKLANIDLEDANIRAPYGGVVIRRHTEVGAYVRAGDPVVSMIDDRHLEIEADVPADKAKDLIAGTAVDYTFSDGMIRRARVRAVLPSENPLTRTRIVRLVPDFALTPKAIQGLVINQSVTLNVPVDSHRDVISVSKDAVLIKDGVRKVFVAAAGKAVLTTVRLGAALGDRFEVIEGLNPGEKVVIRGNERLRDGQSIAIEGGAS